MTAELDKGEIAGLSKDAPWKGRLLADIPRPYSLPLLFWEGKEATVVNEEVILAYRRLRTGTDTEIGDKILVAKTRAVYVTVAYLDEVVRSRPQRREFEGEFGVFIADIRPRRRLIYIAEKYKLECGEAVNDGRYHPNMVVALSSTDPITTETINGTRNFIDYLRTRVPRIRS